MNADFYFWNERPSKTMFDFKTDQKLYYFSNKWQFIWTTFELNNFWMDFILKCFEAIRLFQLWQLKLSHSELWQLKLWQLELSHSELWQLEL